jgi:hypothetical protein
MSTATTPQPGSLPPTRPDISGLHLSGFGMVRDSVSVALEAAARCLGREADYERIYLCSGNAFAPAIDPGGSCRSWWHVEARNGTGNLPALAASLGLSAEVLTLPPRPAKDDPALPAWFSAVTVRIAAAMDSGAIVLSDGGWKEAGSWNWAGIITELGADGVIRGATLSAATGDGKEGVEWCYPGTLWTIRPASTRTPPSEVDRATLRLAVGRIRGKGAYAPRADVIFGLPAVDRWIATMKTDRGFCATCFSDHAVPGVHDAADNDKRMCAAAQVLARQLRSGMLSLPNEARRPLEQAANCYQRIAKILGEPLDTPGFYDRLTSLEAQDAYARRQLTWMRAELVAAAGRCEEALRLAEGRPAELRLAGGEGDPEIRIEGLESIGNPRDADWFAASLRFQVKQVGVEVDYHTLMGDLGMAFIMQASDQEPIVNGALDAGWWPLDPVGVPLFLDFVGQVHGFQAEYAASATGDRGAVAYREHVAPRIEAETRALRPSLGLFPWWNVIVGVNRETGQLVRICPGTNTMPDFWENGPEKPFAFVFLRGRTAPTLARPEADRLAIRHALTLMRDEIALPHGYRSGARGFAIWAAALRDTAHRGQSRWHGNVVRRLRYNRQAAVVYLEAMTSRWPETAAAHLRSAIIRYQGVISACGEAKTNDAALVDPGDGREDLARLVERLAELEVQAAQELALALAAMPAPTGATGP